MRTSFAVLVGVAVVGLGALESPSALAGPSLADCVDLRYPDRQIVLEQDNNIEVTVGVVAGKEFRNPVSYVLRKPGNNPVSGDVQGGIRRTDIDFTVNWSNGFTNHYVGRIYDDGTANGTTVNTANGRFVCEDLAPLYTATISARTDLYDFPNGTVFSWLNRGTSVNVVQRRDGNWLEVSGTQVPDGRGWVKGDFVIPN